MTALIAFATGALAYRLAGKLLRLLTAQKFGHAGELRKAVLNKMSYDGLLNLRDAVDAEVAHRREPTA